jgi:hypothetical protein
MYRLAGEPCLADARRADQHHAAAYPARRLAADVGYLTWASR